MPTQEHPFAQYIRILGKGKKGSRPLSQQEAYSAMTMIMNDQVEPVQLGAFLMLMRVKEETSEELAGFVQAVKESIPVSLASESYADLDWSSYAGKRRHLPWFLLSTFLLAQNGIKVFMHGADGHTEGRIYTEQVLLDLGIQPAQNIEQSLEQLRTHYFSYLPIRSFCPKLHELINMRSLMGLRSPVHTLVRLINPLNATHTIQGIFHPSYRQVHQKAALLLNQEYMAVLKGEGGETERNPDTECLVQSIIQQQLIDETWPALFSKRHLKEEILNPLHMQEVWMDHKKNEFAEATIISTTAIALKLLNKASDQTEAINLAEKYWKNRSTEFLPNQL
jgi:anthranilate phosphoribosyltransferase